MLGVDVLGVVVGAFGRDVHEGDCDEDTTGESVRDAKNFGVPAALAEPEGEHPTDESLDEQNEY
jgi:hypothetical protein